MSSYCLRTTGRAIGALHVLPRKGALRYLFSIYIFILLKIIFNSLNRRQPHVLPPDLTELSHAENI